jgi:hypothetical protein
MKSLISILALVLVATAIAPASLSACDEYGERVTSYRETRTWIEGHYERHGHCEDWVPGHWQVTREPVTEIVVVHHDHDRGYRHHDHEDRWQDRREHRGDDRRSVAVAPVVVPVPLPLPFPFPFFHHR